MNRALTRLALAWGIRRALRSARGMGRGMGPVSFLGGLGVGAGLMYLIAGRGSHQPTRRAAPRRTLTAGRTPAPRRTSGGSPRAKAR